VFAIAVLSALAAAAPASAGEVSVQAGVLMIAGENIDIEATPDGTDYSVLDWSGALSAGDGCTLDTPEPPLLGPVGDRTFTCAGPIAAVDASPVGEWSSIFLLADVPKRFHGGDGRDFFYGGGSGPTEATGGKGRDSLTGGSGADLLDGGDDDDDLGGQDGEDHLIGGPGSDYLSGDSYEGTFEGEPGASAPTGSPDVLEGGGGNDYLYGGIGADRLLGGAGRDLAIYERSTDVTLTIGAPGGEDELEVENINTDKGADTIRGDARPNEIRTADGNDTVDPGTGPDNVDTGKGDDTVDLRDGEVDDLTCGEGADRVTADPVDAVDESCEAVVRMAAPPVAAAPAPAPAGTAPQGLMLTLRRKGRTAILRGTLQMPAGTATALCDGGGVTVTVAGIGRRGAVLDGRCRFSLRLRTRTRRLRGQARFAGTPALAAFDSGRRTLR
jgi:Ca2+-binding RTX toxin-like protein